MQGFLFPLLQIQMNDSKLMTMFGYLHMKQYSPNLSPVLKPTVSESIAGRQNSKSVIMLHLITDEQDLRVQLYFPFDNQP